MLFNPTKRPVTSFVTICSIVANILINNGLTTINFIYGGFISIGCDLLFSIPFLCKIIDIACCVAMVHLRAFFGILNFFSMINIGEICVVAFALVVMAINGSTFHPLFVMLFMKS